MTIAFDTLEYCETLSKAGFTAVQADALTKATSNAFDQLINLKKITTKDDLLTLKNELQAFFLKSLGSVLMILSSLNVILRYL